MKQTDTEKWKARAREVLASSCFDGCPVPPCGCVDDFAAALAEAAAEEREELAVLREMLETIERVLDDEIGTRFRTSSHKTEEQMGRNSTIYSLLSLPRNMASSALAQAAAIRAREQKP